MARSRMSMIRGRIAVPGIAGIKPLDVMKISKMGNRFNGKTLVTGFRHRVDASGWQTDVQFGLAPDWFCRQEAIEDVPAAGLLPAVATSNAAVNTELGEKIAIASSTALATIGLAMWARKKQRRRPRSC